MLQNKKLLTLAVTALCGTMLLAGCDAVKAAPTDDVYYGSLLNVDNVTYNTFKRIYDSLVTEGDTNSEKVLKNALYLYSTTIYGSFFDQTVDGVTVKGLKTIVDAYEADTTNTTEIQTFADAHEVFHDATGKGAIAKVVNFYCDVLYRLRTSFEGYVKDTTYQVRNKFIEKKFYDAQTKNYYKLGDKYYSDAGKQVVGSLRISENYAESGAMILDAKGSASVTNAYFFDIFGTYSEYIETSLLPDIYRNELTVQYLYTENQGQIRLTSARKADIIALPNNAQYPNAVRDLVISYSKNVIDTGLDTTKYGFTFLNSLYKCSDYDSLTGEAKTLADTIYNEAGWTADSITVGASTVNFYKESSYGTIAASYQKLKDDRFSDDTTVRNDFTGSGTYTVETGLTIKTNALRAEDKTTYGWFTGSGLDSKLPDSLKKRCFNIQVANEVDSPVYSATTGYADADLKYGYYRGGNYYLIPEKVEDGNKYPYAVFDSSTWYIARVEEAVKSAKINSSDTKSYYDNMTKNASTPYFGENVARKIAYSLSSSDNWKKSAQQYYVDKMAIVYHDTYVLDYFKKTFPDLFD